MEPKRTVCVVDDDPGMRESLLILLKTADIEARVFGTAEGFLAAIKDEKPICALVDVFLPGMSGLALQERLAERGIEAALIFMTGQADVPMAVQAMRAGALHFIVKPFDAVDLLDVVNDAVRHKTELKQEHAVRAEAEETLKSLTPRERDVLSLLVEGYQNKVVAARLGISTRTAEHHRAHIMAKMNARTLVHLVKISAGITTLPNDRLARTADSTRIT